MALLGGRDDARTGGGGRMRGVGDDSVQLEWVKRSSESMQRPTQECGGLLASIDFTRHVHSNAMVPTQDIRKSDEVIVKRRNVVARSSGLGGQITIQEIESCYGKAIQSI